MRSSLFALAALSAVAASAGPSQAQQVALNHLDCRFDQTTQAIMCPDVLSGRASAAGLPPAQASSAAADVKPAKGSPEWNAQCAGKYKSFDPATGLYRSFSGQMKPCV